MQKEQLSALMDGETLDSELLNELAHNPEMQKTWESYHLIRDSMRGDTPEVLHFDISSRVMAAIEEEPVRQPATLIPEAQPAPHQWQKMPFWQKVRPWAAQLTQMGVAACVSLAVIVGVQHYNGQSETSQQPESAACTSLTLSAPTVTFEDAGRFFNLLTRRPAAAVSNSRCRSSVVVSMLCCRITNCNADSTLNSFSLSRRKPSKPLYRCQEFKL